MSQHFTTGRLLRFTLPVIATMLLTSAYVMADGFFVSHWCGSEALAAVNFAYPVPMVIGSLGFMLGTGGSAIVAKTLGQGDEALARRQFSLIVYAGIVAGVVCALVSTVALRPILDLMGAQDNLLELCMTYGTILCLGLPATIL